MGRAGPVPADGVIVDSDAAARHVVVRRPAVRRSGTTGPRADSAVICAGRSGAGARRACVPTRGHVPRRPRAPWSSPTGAAHWFVAHVVARNRRGPGAARRHERPVARAAGTSPPGPPQRRAARRVRRPAPVAGRRARCAARLRHGRRTCPTPASPSGAPRPAASRSSSAAAAVGSTASGSPRSAKLSHPSGSNRTPASRDRAWDRHDIQH